MARALILFAHPCEESFSSILHRTVLDGLKQRGWEVDDCDLYAEGFNPVLSAAERRGYHDTATNTAPVADHVARLQAAQGLVMVFPVWNYGYPAILKGYFDRVFLPGVSFKLENGKVSPALKNFTKVAVVTTYGGTRFKSFLAGDPPRTLIKRTLRGMTWPARLDFMALYDMNNVGDSERRAFQSRVARRMAAF